MILNTLLIRSTGEAATPRWLPKLIGGVYAALLPRLSVDPLVGGLITGGVLHALGFWILPQLFPTWLGPFRLPPMARLLQALAHAVYGMTLGYTFRHLEKRSV